MKVEDQIQESSLLASARYDIGIRASSLAAFVGDDGESRSQPRRS